MPDHDNDDRETAKLGVPSGPRRFHSKSDNPKALGLFLLGRAAFKVGLEDGDIDLMLRGSRMVRDYRPADDADKRKDKKEG
jgi:hypothetical protein